MSNKPTKYIQCRSRNNNSELVMTEGSSATKGQTRVRCSLFKHICKLVTDSLYRSIWKTESDYKFYGVFRRKYKLNK